MEGALFLFQSGSPPRPGSHFSGFAVTSHPAVGLFFFDFIILGPSRRRYFSISFLQLTTGLTPQLVRAVGRLPPPLKNSWLLHIGNGLGPFLLSKSLSARNPAPSMVIYLTPPSRQSKFPGPFATEPSLPPGNHSPQRHGSPMSLSPIPVPPPSPRLSPPPPSTNQVGISFNGSRANGDLQMGDRPFLYFISFSTPLHVDLGGTPPDRGKPNLSFRPQDPATGFPEIPPLFLQDSSRR